MLPDETHGIIAMEITTSTNATFPPPLRTGPLERQISVAGSPDIPSEELRLSTLSPTLMAIPLGVEDMARFGLH